MKHHIFLGGNQDELFFEKINIKFLVHKSLINKDTSSMIHKYMKSLKQPINVKVDVKNDVCIFRPIDCEERNSVESSENYLWFAL